MPDLMKVPMAMCKSNEYWEKHVPSSKPNHPGYTVIFDVNSHTNREYAADFSCNCPAYQYGKGKYCKHIIQVKGEHCGWHQQIDGGEVKNKKCPKCGGEVTWFMAGV